MAKVKTIEIVDIENVRNEKLRYQKNTLAYGLGLLGCLLSLFAGFVGLNTIKPDKLVIVKIGINILILLFGFSSCENAKNYKKSSIYFFFIFAIADILRILWIPRYMFAHWNDYKKSNDSTVLDKYFSDVVESSSDKTRGWLPSSGTFRGILMMIFLISSAVCFAFAGYVALNKTNRLHKYLKSINVEF